MGKTQTAGPGPGNETRYAVAPPTDLSDMSPPSTVHPRDALFDAGEAAGVALPVCDHYAGVEARMRKSLELQAELGPVFDVTLDNEDGAPVGGEREQAALERVGSYGRQIGHLAEALELIVKKTKLLDSPDLTPHERDVLQVFLGDVSTIRQIKASLSDA